MNPGQPSVSSTDAPSSSDEEGRGNSGEGKDPKEGLYPASAPASRPPAEGAPAASTPSGDDA